jgi:hypothetical protein
MRILAALAALILACSSPAICGCGDAGDDAPAGELPETFTADAEIVSVEPGPDVAPSAVDLCTPSPADRDADDPDWRVRFAHMRDANEPTFRAASHNGDSAEVCTLTGGTDCCRPVEAVAGGWSLECNGQMDGVQAINVFVFSFHEDGSGTATAALTNVSTGKLVCTSRVEWSAIVAL